MGIQFYGGAMLFVGGAIAMHADCCCVQCGCQAGTLPTSLDIYFENCTGVFTCLEGVTVNLSIFDPDTCTWYTDIEVCICDAVWRISIDLSSGAGNIWFVSQIETSSTAPGCSGAGPYFVESDISSNLTDHDCMEVKTGSFAYTLPGHTCDFTITPVA